MIKNKVITDDPKVFVDGYGITIHNASATVKITLVSVVQLIDIYL